VPDLLLAIGGAAGALSFLCWLALALRPERAWDCRPVAEDEPAPPDPASWPSVCILVPARNEEAMLRRTLPALLAQDYPGEWRILVVDDRSRDRSSEAVASLGGARLSLLRGAELPDRWAGKVWAMHQGAAAATERYLLLTDADILHAPASLRRLVAESEAGGLALNSRMARLRCESAAERLLIPAFVWFFGLLYPMRRVNRPESPAAAAAGGCVLLRRDALDRAGGFESIRSEIIDDVNLARRIKGSGGSLRLSLSRDGVRSLREYPTPGTVWRMVRRTAFTELKHSWLRLAGVMLTMTLMFAAPPLLLAGGLALAADDPRALAVAGAGLAAWALAAALYRPAVRFFGLSGARALALPLVGALYGLMTLDSALRGGRNGWRAV
jgi:hopene-associated glycosyltransferase HpnB